MADFWTQFGTVTQSLYVLFIVLTALLHILYAAGVAKDLGERSKKHLPTMFLPNVAWVLATLLGGLLTLVAYWLLHHSSLSRSGG